jgi:hypothetical protein
MHLAPQNGKVTNYAYFLYTHYLTLFNQNPYDATLSEIQYKMDCNILQKYYKNHGMYS